MGSWKNRRWAGALLALAAAFFVWRGVGVPVPGLDRSRVDAGGGGRDGGDGGPPRIELVEEGAAVVVLGLESTLIDALNRSEPSSEGWQSLFPVRITSDAGSDLPMMLGTYAVEEDRVVFRPRFAPVPGTSYTARFDPGELAGLVGAAVFEELEAAFEELEAELSVPLNASAPPTRVVQIYPTAPIVPMNLLKMYVHFSAPMRFGEAYEHIQLRTASGEVVPDAILNVLEELWDPERRRLTLLFDPGRIKRGNEPNLTLGLPLRDGESYILEIDDGWRDGSGRPLAEGFSKAFSAGAADRVSPDTDTWMVGAPAAGSREPLEIVFPEPMDRALLDRLITVLTERGERVEGRIEVTNNETVWRLTLDRPWDAGSYVIDVHADLEDLAGNNLAHLFDVDLSQDVRLSEVEAHGRLPFEVRRAGG